jgi:predicted ATPase
MLTMQGQAEPGLAQIRQAVAALQAVESAGTIPTALAWLAEAYGQVGQVDEALRLIAEALATVETTGGRRAEAELHWLSGALLQRQAVPDVLAAEARFQQALAIARRQQAKSWELRAATSLARLWQQHGKRQDAYALLAPVYEWFTEGFDTVDLQEAKALLDELA